MNPVVFALMPTLPNREELRDRAISSYSKQRYSKEWTVNLLIDPGPETLGAKLNRMVQSALEFDATHVILLDDDDVHSPHRIQTQIDPLLHNSNLAMTGTSVIVFRRDSTGEIFRYRGLSSMWIGGLAFPVSSWQKHKFTDITAGTDTIWQKNFPLETRLDLKDESLMLCTIHPRNSSAKHTVGREWMQLSSVPESLLGL